MNHAQFWGGGGAAPYAIDQSLRFNSADSAYLSRTPASAGNRKTWTWSGWVKYTVKNNTSTFNQPLFWANNSASSGISFSQDPDTAHRIFVYNAGFNIQTTQFFRDPSSWYHIVAVIDTTQATASNRTKLYINGVQVTDLATASYPTQNTDTDINNTVEHNIGKQIGQSRYLDAYLSEVNFIDGSALDPDQFAELDDNGVWRPIKYAGSYTGNSFYLKFASGDGTDSSGLSNTWTANNFTTSGTGTDVMSDTPTKNWCTLNPLIVNNSTYLDPAVLSDGNLVASQTSVPNNTFCAGTFKLPSSGKWYWEVKQDALQTDVTMGIGRVPWDPTSDTSARDAMYGYKANGDKFKLGTASSYGSSWANGDIVGVAVDMDNTTISFYKNGTSQGNAFTDIDTAYDYVPMTWANDPNRNVWVYNFGQRAFAYTPPTGYKALNTSNLSSPDIADGSEYSDTVLDTGANILSSAQSTFSNGLWWVKDRANSNQHQLVDSVRGGNLRLTTPSETTEAAYSAPSGNSVAWCWNLAADRSNGFDIVTYSGNSGVQNVSHNLSEAPEFMIVCNRNRGSAAHRVYHADQGPTKVGELNTSSGFYADTTWNNTAPTNSVFTLGNTSMNQAYNYVAYLWHSVPGYSSFGSYTGNGNADGPFVYCGFRPRWIMFKATGAGYWGIYDAARNTYNAATLALYPNDSLAESTDQPFDFLSNGFKIRGATSFVNTNGGTYIFAAFAEHPTGGSGVSPATAR